MKVPSDDEEDEYEKAQSQQDTEHHTNYHQGVNTAICKTHQYKHS